MSVPMLVGMQGAVVSLVVLVIRLLRYLLFITPIVISLPALYMGHRAETMWYSIALYCIGNILVGYGADLHMLSQYVDL